MKKIDKYLCANRYCGNLFKASCGTYGAECVSCGLVQRPRSLAIWQELDRKYRQSSRPLALGPHTTDPVVDFATGDFATRSSAKSVSGLGNDCVESDSVNSGRVNYRPRQDAENEQHEDPRFVTRPNRVVVVEDSRSQWNVGSILRTADCFGWKVVLCGISPTPDQPGNTIAKTALGAESWVDWRYAARISDVIQYYQNRDYQLVALEQTDDAALIDRHQADGSRFIPQALCLIIGNERDGLSPEALSCIERRVVIPMHGRKASLNVAISFGIAAFTI